MKRAMLVGGLVAAFTAVSLGPAWAQSGAKALFYGPSASGPTVMAGSPAKPTGVAKAKTPAEVGKHDTYLGVSYWVELVGADGQRRRVTTNHVFRSGDRIKLHVQSNSDGYLYVLNIGSTGRTHLLFPQPGGANRENVVRANAALEIPAGGHIRFDSNPGEEEMLIMFSSSTMTELGLGQARQTAGLTRDEARRLIDSAQAKGAKDLVVEVDGAGVQPASYVVAPVASLQGGGMITVRAKLKHQ